MKIQGFNPHTKYRILQHGLKGKNISKTCKLFGISRTTFYNWQTLYQKYGMIGLENKEAQRPKMPNKVSKAIERDILDYVIRYPNDGPRRIYYELKSEGIDVGETGIYNVLKRNNLTKGKDRVEYSKNKTLESRKKKPNDCDLGNIMNCQESYPGFLVTQRIDFMGTFEGIGRVYQYSFFDIHSKWGEAKLYNKKLDIDIWNFFEHKLVYLLEIFNLNIVNIVSQKEREFLPYFLKGEKYDAIIKKYNINHIFASSKDGEVFKGIGEFNKFLVREFYNKITINSKIDSFLKMENAMNSFVREYNFTNKNTIGPSLGKTPAEAVLQRAIENGTDMDTLPLWLLALINSPRGLMNEEK